MADKTKPELRTHDKGTMANMLEYSNKSLASYGLDEEANKAAEERLKKGYMLDDVAHGVSDDLALRTMLLGDDTGSLPEDRIHINVDVDKMAKDINSNADLGLSYDERQRYKRTLQIIDKIQKNNLVITKAPSGRYWFESNEDGTRHYAANSILEVAELLDMYDVEGSKVNYGVTSDIKEKPKDKKTEETPVNTESEIVDNLLETPAAPIEDLVGDTIEEFKFTTADKWKLASIGTDIGSTIAGLGFKAAAPATLGASYLIGGGINLLGGLSSAAMGYYGDYLDPDVTASERNKMLGIALGSELVEAVGIAPTSLLSTGNRFLKVAGNVFKRAARAGMLGGAAHAVYNTDFKELTKKNVADWGVDDWRKAAFVVETAISLGSSRVGGRRSARKDVQKLAEDVGDVKGIEKVAKKGAPKAAEKNTQRVDNTANKVVSKAKVDGEVKVKEAKKLKQTVDKKLRAKVAKVRRSVTSTYSKDVKTANAEYKAKLKKINSRKKGEQQPTADEKTKLRAAAKAEREAAIKTANDNKHKNYAKAEADKKATASKIKSDHEAHVKKIQTDVDDSIAGINKKSEAIKTRLIARAEKDLVSKEKLTRLENLTKGEKALGRTFSNSISERIIKKAYRKADAEGLYAKRKAKIEKEVAKAKEASSKLGREKEKLKKVDADIAKAGSNVKPKQLEKQKKLKASIKNKEASMEKDTWIKRNIYSPASKVNNAVFDPAKAKARRVLDEANPFADRFYKGIGLSPAMHSVKRGPITDAVVGYKDFEYSKDEMLNILMREGYTEDELANLSYNQLRAAVRSLEGGARPVKNNYNARPMFERGGKIKMLAAAKVRKAQRGDILAPRLRYEDLTREQVAELTMLNGDLVTDSEGYLTGAGGRPLDIPAGFMQEGMDALGSRIKYDTLAPHQIQALTTLNGRLTVDKDGYVLGQEGRPLQVPEGLLDSAPGGEGTTEDTKNIQTEIDKEKEKIVALKEQLENQKLNSDYNNENLNEGGVGLQSQEDVEKLYNSLSQSVRKVQDLEEAKKLTFKDASKSLLPILGDLRPSDFTKSKMFVDRPDIKDLIFRARQSGPITNMPGYSSAMSQASKQPRIDTADSLAFNTMKTSMHNKAIQNKLAYGAKNAEFIQKQRDAALATDNANRQGQAAVQNQNTQARNARESQYTKEYNTARARVDQENRAREARIVDSLYKGGKKMVGDNKKEALMRKYNNLANLKSIWNTEYAPILAKKLELGDSDVESKKLKNRFMEQYDVNPDDLNKGLLDIKTDMDFI